ncbi:unnamed protein product [Schistosoma margrebowiei]|uniref:Sm domain-containing protein n=1 Tax=Schistosoma margrebowiei TaxID=48269 RepID=A0AA85ACS9_9TREM|nr:unnamed protein product [Schistosoma margrebowiei]
MTLSEPSFKTKDEAKDFLNCLCDQELTVHVSDGRRYIGTFWCTDNAGNIVMGSCTEYPAPDSASDNLLRDLTTVVIPGQHIIKIECDSRLLANRFI